MIFFHAKALFLTSLLSGFRRPRVPLVIIVAREAGLWDYRYCLHIGDIYDVLSKKLKKAILKNGMQKISRRIVLFFQVLINFFMCLNLIVFKD